MPAKKKPGDSFRLPHRRHEYFNFFVPQPLGVVPMCESGRNILAKHKKKRRINILRFLLHSYSIEIALNYFFSIFTVITKAALSFKQSLRCFNPAIYESTLVGSFDTIESSNSDGFLPPK